MTGFTMNLYMLFTLRNIKFMWIEILPPETIHHIIEEAVHSICDAREKMIEIEIHEWFCVDWLGFCFSQHHFI